ncbi:unnamed protein product [Didymodactylos carnosus]|uniref:Uncharacterized protein n=1 Tax=Didymodactylos carnosus TaxID=1234261 RepID=A0A814VE93_9BILA|nr:unnamed protein product [Didymodactylos carnosus]CAF1186950.1 unnamed protein product [Didymodactylos carnosus]CAF3847788.1 unnamed protein product [Didymodactylos carnosus]CAF3951184.1 unnamed protein product [Didymodactylos carnosus]
MQTDPNLVGSVVTLNNSIIHSTNSRRQRKSLSRNIDQRGVISETMILTCDLHIIMDSSLCPTNVCAQTFRNRVVNMFTSTSNKSTPTVRYQQNSETYYFMYRLPPTCNTRP